MGKHEFPGLRLSFGVKRCILENNQSYILSPRIGPEWLSDRCQSLTDGCRVVWSHPVGWIMDARWMSGGLDM